VAGNVGSGSGNATSSQSISRINKSHITAENTPHHTRPRDVITTIHTSRHLVVAGGHTTNTSTRMNTVTSPFYHATSSLPRRAGWLATERGVRTPLQYACRIPSVTSRHDTAITTSHCRLCEPPFCRANRNTPPLLATELHNIMRLRHCYATLAYAAGYIRGHTTAAGIETLATA